MKVVVCENCGAKYQLDDSDDINAFECSSCTGALKELENFSETENRASSNQISSDSDSVLVYCRDCGLKFQIDKEDDINDYECASCEGPLDYVSNVSDFYEDSIDSQSSISSDEVENQAVLDDVYSDADEIIPIHADSDYDEDEIVPIHADSDYDDEIIPVHAEESYQTEEVQYAEYDSEDDIIPIHAESSSIEGDGQYYDPNSEIDEIIPIHADPNYNADYQDSYDSDDSDDDYDEYYEKDSDSYYDGGSDSYYESTLPNLDDLESSPAEFAESYYSPGYDSPIGDVDEIIPIHAEKRYMETSRDLASGFAYSNSDYDDSELFEEDLYYSEGESARSSDETDNAQSRLVDVTDIPEEELSESPLQLKRKELSEEDQRLFARVQNEMVFDSPEEYEAFRLARYKYYVALLDILKEEYVKSLEDEFDANSSVKRLIRKGEESVKQSNLKADDSNSLVTKETIEMMKSNRHYEPRKSNADVLILVGLFIMVVALVYYFIVSAIMYVLLAVALGAVILIYGAYKKYRFNEYLTRGRIIRERLLALPNDFYVFYAVQPPGSKDIINHVVVGPTGVFTILSQRYDSKDYKNKVKSDNETDGMVNDSASIQDYRQKKNTLELQTDYADNQSRFQFGNEEIHFEQNSQIKRKALELNEDLAIFLDNKGFSGIYIEPLIGFVNDDLAILNVILTNEDLFIDELFNKMIRGRRRLDELTIAKIARLLSFYAADCSVY